MFFVIRFINIQFLHSIFRSVRMLTDVVVGMLVYVVTLLLLRDSFLINGIKQVLKKVKTQ